MSAKLLLKYFPAVHKVLARLCKIPYFLPQSGVPVGQGPSGSIGNNGAVTFGTALPTTYSGGIYLYFPANTIAAGVPAGLYWTVMSSTTVGTIYNNTYVSGDPTAPASPTPFVTTGPGAYTQSTAEITLRSLTIPGGSMGPNGALNIESFISIANTAGTKTPRVRFAGISTYSNPYTTSAGSLGFARVMNKNSQSVQCMTGGGSSGGNGSTAVSYQAINTASDQVVTATGQLGTATDWLISEYLTVQVCPS